MNQYGKGEKRKISKRSVWLVFVGLLVTIQGGLLWMDYHPMFFLGDSESYIWTSISGGIPSDRSFVYGYFIRLIALTTQTLTSLVIMQVLLLIGTSVVMAHLLIRYFRVEPWIAFMAALLTSLEPLQLLYTRYVMTETLALSVFVFYVWIALQYMEDPRITWLCLAHGVAGVMISIRFAFIPLAWVCAAAMPILAFPAITLKAHLKSAKTTSRLAVHFIISVFLVFLFTTTYKYFHGYLQNNVHAFSYDSGFFAMSFILPIMGPEDFRDIKLGSSVFTDLNFSFYQRPARACRAPLDERRGCFPTERD